MTPALLHLASVCSTMALVIEEIGEPVIRRRPRGGASLARIIIEQQLSVASANAIRGRIEAAFGELDAAIIAAADEDALRALGLSRPKVRYLKALATALNTGELDLDGIDALTDEEAASQLLTVTGIGPWTAAVYLLFCEGRDDVWVPKDVALRGAFAAAAALEAAPPMAEFDAGAARYAPYRGIAAHCLWTFYGHRRGRRPQ